MPQPTRGDVHVNRPLTNISIAYVQRSEDFVADKVFPNIPVQKQSDLYFVYDKEYWFRTESRKRGPATESAGSGYELLTASYFADVWAVHKDVDDQTRSNSDQPLDPDRDATIFVTQQNLLRREKEFMSNYMSTGIWTGSTTGGDITPSTKWDAASGDPIGDVDTQMSAVKRSTGFRPNTIVVSDDVFYAIKNNADVLDRIKYTQRAVVTPDLLAALFGVDKFLVASATENTAAEGQSESMSFLTSDSMLLCYANPAPSIMMPSAGYTFSWTGLFGSGTQGNRIKTFRMEQLAADRVEGEMAFDLKLVAADLGVYFTGVLTA